MERLWFQEREKNIPVSTNCPTVAENPARKALKGCKTEIL